MKAAVKSRVVTKSRIIAAIFSELDASRAELTARCVESGQELRTTLSCEFKVPFSESVITLPESEIPMQALDCACCYAGQRFTFRLERVQDALWALPQSLEISDLRRNARYAFAAGLYSAEVVTRRGAFYGLAIDIDAEHLCIEIDGSHHAREGDDVKVIVRMVNTNRDVFYRTCKIAQIKASGAGKYRVIFDITADQQNTHPSGRQHKRHDVEGVSMSLGGLPFVDGSEFRDFHVLNVSAAGLVVRCRSKSDRDNIVPGLIFRSETSDIAFMVVWIHGGVVGLKAHLADASQLKVWHQILEQWKPEEAISSAVTRRELAQLLTQSGLIKGIRRTPFGDDLALHLIVNQLAESPLLFQRCVFASDSQKNNLHVSYKRISELSWFFGEGAALTEKVGDYNRMLDVCTNQMAHLSKQSSLHCRYITAIWHHTIKSTASWGEMLAASQQSRLFESYQISISNWYDGHALDNKLNLSPLNFVEAESRRSVMLQFSPMLYEAFAGHNGTHPILNSELGKLGPYHKAVTKVVLSGASTLLIHRIITHNVWSTTGVTNSVFVLVPRGCAPQDLAAALTAISQDDVSYGTDDFLLIFDGEKDACLAYEATLPSPKRFSFLVHDLLLNEELAYKDVRDDGE